MKQQTDTTNSKQQKIDPLMRIQEEIKEELRREREYKKLLIAGGALPYTEDDNEDDAETESSLLNMTQVNETAFTVYNSNGEKHTEESHSDDSGISAASSPVNGTTVNTSIVQTSSIITTSTTMTSSEEHLRINIKEPRYIGPNCYNLTPDPPKQKIMLRTISTPHLNAVQSRNLTGISTQKGLMQRFIASRGKLQIANNNVRRENESAAALALASNTTSNGAMITLNTNSIQSLNAATFNFDKAATTWQPAVIERDQDGRPIRPGYVPVELKIQRELQDLKSRESELKKQRKIRQSTPDLLNALEDESIEYINSVDGDEDDDADSTEHCYGPNKMRSAKSIGELNEPMHYFNNNNGKNSRNDETDGMRPAVSLAQLCDLDPEEAPSSHRLIAQWESLIQQNA